MPICDEWTLVNNMNLAPEVVAKSDAFGTVIYNNELWDSIKKIAMIKANGIDGDASFTEKVMFGLNIALRKMAEEAALQDKSLVIGDKEGNAKLVPAKELLKTLPKK